MCNCNSYYCPFLDSTPCEDVPGNYRNGQYLGLPCDDCNEYSDEDED